MVSKQEEFFNAKLFLNTAKRIYIRYTNKENSHQFLSILNGLSLHFTDIGEYKSSNELVMQVINICEKENRTNIPEYGLAINQLGINNMRQGYLTEAENHFCKAITILEPIFKKDHAFMLTINTNLAFVYLVQNNKRFLELSETIQETFMQNIGENLQFLTTEQREHYLGKMWSSIYYAYSFALNNESWKLNNQMYTNILYTKGLLLRSSNNLKSAVYQSENEQLIANYERLLNLKEVLITQNEQHVINRLKTEAELLEKQLADSLENEFSLDTPDWEMVKKSLAKGEAAIEFVAFPFIDKSMENPIKYAALLITHKSKSPVFIPLCSEEELSILLDRKKMKQDEFTEKLYSSELYKLVWQPLEKYLKDDGVRTIYYSTSGLLNHLSFRAIPIESERLMDKYSLCLLSSTAEIASIKKQETRELKQAVVYGGIQYDALRDSLIASANLYQVASDNTTPIVRGNEEERKGWNYLYGTVTEVNSIAELLNKQGITTQKLTRHYANEESFKNLSGAQTDIIHIATHGYWLSNEEDILSNKFLQDRAQKGMDVSGFMFRTGLLMAGANRVWTGKNQISGIEDGILTAKEISNLNLANTQLVVLSACNTGQGHVSIVEGVFGLQRAFKLAGAETIIMSLWSVPDETTSLLMTLFYENWLSGMDKQKALLKARSTIREKHPNPYYWAGFVMLD